MSETEPENPWANRETVIEAHQRWGEGTTLGVDDILRMLQPGDEVVWEGRVQSLEVQRQSSGAGTVFSGGYWDDDATWQVEGPQGGEYRISNWWHFTDDGDQADKRRPAKVYPQVYRTTDGSWESQGHIHAMAIVSGADWTLAEGAADDLADATRIAWVQPEGGRRVDEVEGCEYRQPIVDAPVDGDGPPVSMAVKWDRILAYTTTEVTR